MFTMQFTTHGGGTAAPMQMHALTVVSRPRNQDDNSAVGTRIWGEPIWTLFHAMAETVRAERFVECKEGLIAVVTMLGANLPCPDCAQHAQRYLSSVNWAQLRTKDEFRLFLCAFHNDVNARKQYASFDPARLTERYASVPVGPAAARALHFFQGKYAAHNRSLVPETLARDRAARMVRAWISANLFLFDK